MSDISALRPSAILGGQIRALRMARRWSQQKLASEARTTAKQISLLERDKRPKGPYYNTAAKIAETIGVQLCAFGAKGPCRCHMLTSLASGR